MADPKKDNSTFTQKVALRQAALQMLAERGIEQPVIGETHGGTGALWAACYAHLDEGYVFEKDAQKVNRLAKQRPTWAVYEGDCVVSLEYGVGAHLQVDLLDVDPYGEPWPTLAAFFGSKRPFAPVLAVAVNDGLRKSVQLGVAWNAHSMKPMVEKYGNDLGQHYLEVCRELMEINAALAGYAVAHFGGYYCGHAQQMTHYLALLECG